jgi:hypothetical protein
MINPDGNELAEWTKEWAKKEVSEVGVRAHDVGKFYFTVASATAATIVAIERLSTTPQIEIWLIVSMLALFLALFTAIFIVLPRHKEFRISTDIQKEHRSSVRGIAVKSFVWFVLWSVGVFCGWLAVMT